MVPKPLNPRWGLLIGSCYWAPTLLFLLCFLKLSTALGCPQLCKRELWVLHPPLLAAMGVSRMQPCSSSPSASFWGYKTTQEAARIEEMLEICFISLPFFLVSCCRASEGCNKDQPKPESSSRNNRTTEEVCACCSPGGWGSCSEKCGRCWWRWWGVSSSPSLLELGVLVLLPALGHFLLSCNGVQGLSTPELLSLLPPHVLMQIFSQRKATSSVFVSLLKSCSDGALLEDAVCPPCRAEAELTQQMDLSSSGECCMLVLGCSRTSIPSTLPGVGSVLPRAPFPLAAGRSIGFPWWCCLAKGCPFGWGVVWLGCSSSSLFSWVWRSSVMVSSAVESCRCGSLVLSLFVFL